MTEIATVYIPNERAATVIAIANKGTRLICFSGYGAVVNL